MGLSSADVQGVTGVVAIVDEDSCFWRFNQLSATDEELIRSSKSHAMNGDI
jgi:hypothetical protein